MSDSHGCFFDLIKRAIIGGMCCVSIFANVNWTVEEKQSQKRNIVYTPYCYFALHYLF